MSVGLTVESCDDDLSVTEARNLRPKKKTSCTSFDPQTLIYIHFHPQSQNCSLYIVKFELAFQSSNNYTTTRYIKGSS